MRYPHITSDLVVFVAADDVWLAPLTGGRAWRFTTDEAQAATPRLTPDGTHVAWVSAKDGSPEIYVASLADGTSTRLTYWATSWARVSGWTPAGEVLAVSEANQPFFHYVRARALTTALSGRPGAERVLPFGPVSDLSLGTSGGGTGGDGAAGGRGADTAGLLTGKFGGFNDDPANWKRYRGGTAGRLWVGPATAIVSDAPDAAGPTAGPFRRVLADLPAQFASPMVVSGRLAFISDHEGTGNVYSCALDGSDLRRHTDHEGWYARQAGTDGRRIVYARGGELWLLNGLTAAEPVRLDITLGSPARGRAPRLVTAEEHIGSLSVDHGGRASSIEVRGTVHWLTHRDGPARAVSVAPGVRARFPQVLGTDGQVVWAADADGGDALEIGSGDPASPADPAAAPRRIAAGQVGRIRQRGRDRARLVARLGLAGVVTAGRASGRHEPQPAPPAAAGADRRRPGLRRHGRAVRRYRAGFHPRWQVPGVPVDARLRSGLRRTLLRPHVPVRGPALPAAPRRDDSVTLRTRAWRAADRRARGQTRGGPGGWRSGGCWRQCGRCRGRRRPAACPAGAGGDHWDG